MLACDELTQIDRGAIMMPSCVDAAAGTITMVNNGLRLVPILAGYGV